jgi:hypothetical protein
LCEISSYKFSPSNPNGRKRVWRFQFYFILAYSILFYKCFLKKANKFSPQKTTKPNKFHENNASSTRFWDPAIRRSRVQKISKSRENHGFFALYFF